MSLFVIADTHLSLTSGKPMDIFGDRWKDHTQKLSKRWSAIVNEEDTVVIPGDISWAMTLDDAMPDLEFISKLPGKKIISKGNHEYWWSTVKKVKAALADRSINNIELLYNNSLSSTGYAICGTRGWYNESAAPDGIDYPKIVARECMRLERSLVDAETNYNDLEKLVFLHFPPVLDKFVCREIINVMTAHNVRKCYFGHIHGRYAIPSEFEYEGITFRLISADYLDFCPHKII